MAPPPSTPDKYPDRSMYDEIVEIKVGDKSFKVHKGIISFYSGYFAKAFKGDFAEGRTGVVILQEEDVDVLERFIGWVYNQRIEEDGLGEDKFWGLAKIWIFADRREVPLLMNTAVDKMRDTIADKWMVPTRMLSFVYENTTVNSGLRLFVRDVIANTGSSKMLEPPSEWNEEALRDVLAKVWDQDASDSFDAEDVADMDMCQYHHHEELAKCEKKAKRKKPTK